MSYGQSSSQCHFQSRCCVSHILRLRQAGKTTAASFNLFCMYKDVGFVGEKKGGKKAQNSVYILPNCHS